MPQDEKIDVLQIAQKKERFLENFREIHTIAGAARATGIDRACVYRWHDADKEFAAKLKDAVQDATEDLEAIAEERAKKFSDTLLIFLLKARDPERFKDRISAEIDVRVLQDIVIDLTAAIKKTVPEFCPHCKTSIDVSNRLSLELLELSKKFGKQTC